MPIPKHPKSRIRQQVREVLYLAQGYALRERAICDFVNEILEPDVGVDEVREAVEWNVAQDYVDVRMNEDFEEHEWKITKHGIAKCQLK